MRERGSVLMIVGLAVAGVVLLSGFALALARLRSTSNRTSTSSQAAVPVQYDLPTLPASNKNPLKSLVGNLPTTGPTSSSLATSASIAITPTFVQPTLTTILSSDKKTLTLTFDKLTGVQRITYSVTYPTSNGDKGANGSFDAPAGGVAVTRDVALGTCSSGGACSYDTVTGAITVRAVFTPIFGVAVEMVRTVPY